MTIIWWRFQCYILYRISYFESRNKDIFYNILYNIYLYFVTLSEYVSFFCSNICISKKDFRLILDNILSAFYLCLTALFLDQHNLWKVPKTWKECIHYFLKQKYQSKIKKKSVSCTYYHWFILQMTSFCYSPSHVIFFLLIPLNVVVCIAQ